MIKKISFLFILILIFSVSVIAQQFPGRRGGGGSSLTGQVFDANEKVPIEYANIIIYTVKDSNQVTGTISKKDGKFILSGIKPGNYYIDIQFIGYNKKRINNITIGQAQRTIDLGKIYIQPAAINLQNVVVEGNRSPVTYQIDKKVIDVSQMATSISGSATDVLENVPSVTVDIDGNVSLRGSSSFTVLIDGKPSVMDAQDILQQIPASSIETIEIITNPSAKYDPEGNAGIINIKLKKEKNLGWGGVVNANAGVNDKYGGDFIFENKSSDFSYNFGLNYNRRFFPGSSMEEKQFGLSSGTSFINSDGSRERGRISFGVRGGFDFNFNESNSLSLGMRYGSRSGKHNSTLKYTQWSTADPQQILYKSINNSDRSGDYYALNLNYQHKFPLKGHELSAELFGSHRNSDESSISEDIKDSGQFSGKKTTESGPSTEFRGKLDYTLPLGENSKFEAGSQGEMDLSDESNGLSDYNSTTGSYEFQPLYSNDTKYNRSELAIYSIYADQFNNLGVQIGARTEYTYRTIELKKTGQSFSIDRWDFFPSIHSSFKFAEGSQLMASYTRRIDRPHGWALEPFFTWQDANNVRKGNPGLQPEFIDSYELGFQTFFGQVTMSNDFYYRVNHNTIDRVRTVYAENVTLNTFENVGNDYSLGSEFMFTFDPVKPWNVNLMGNIYDYRIKGNLYGEPFERQSFNWRIRMNNSFKLFASTMIQLNARYNSPSVSSQGTRKGYFSTDLAIKQDLLNRNISLTLQVRDLLNTARWEFTSTGQDFYSSSRFSREAPMVMLNVKFNFNNYKDNERSPNNGGSQDGGFEGQQFDN